MKPNPEIGQGRNGDVQAPELNRLLLIFVGCVAIATLIAIGGVAWGGVKFVGGAAFGGMFVFVMACFALEWVGKK